MTDEGCKELLMSTVVYLIQHCLFREECRTIMQLREVRPWLATLGWNWEERILKHS